MALTNVHFGQRLAERALEVGSTSCVGLDPHLDRLPSSFVGRVQGALASGNREGAAIAVEEFCMGTVDSLAGVVPALKPQAAFFEQLGWSGVRALENVIEHARSKGLLVILDAKRGDIGSTAKAYASTGLAPGASCASDAMTVSPYLGPESLEPYTRYFSDGAGIFVLVRTSNPGSLSWQHPQGDGIAARVSEWIAAQNRQETGTYGLGPVGAVIGATLSDEASLWRKRMPNAWFLVPGFGAQGATAEDVAHHFREDGLGALITASRSVLFPQSGVDGADWKTAIRFRAEAFSEEVRKATPSP